MKFLIDANLPFKLAKGFKNLGYDVAHTNELPNQERTTDEEINSLSKEEERIVITKDADFLDSHIINGIPPKLLLITTGNISNSELRHILEVNFKRILQLFENYDLIEMDNEKLIVHEK